LNLKTHKHLLVLLIFGWATIFFYLWFAKSPYFSVFLNWAQQHLILYVSVLILLKIVGIIWPPLPGGLFTLGSIPVLGWPLAYAADFVGSAIGSSVAYFIAKKYGKNFVAKIFDEDSLEKINRVRIKPNREIESIFLLRIFGGNIIEVICYGAGLLGVRFKNYLIASLLSHLALGIPIFYLAQDFFSGQRVLINLALVGFAALLFYKLKHRYFEFN